MTELVLTDTELRVRKDFSKIPQILDIPDLIEIQKQTFERFLQTNVEPEKRENVGLQSVFNSVFPIKDFNDSASLEFVGYTLEEPAVSSHATRRIVTLNGDLKTELNPNVNP